MMPQKRPTLPLLLLSLASLASTGCVVVRERPAAVSPDEIIRLSEEGVAPDQIIEKIRASRTVYRMDSEDIVRLSERGVDKQVIDYMMNTERREIERQYYYYGPYYYGPYYYPYHWPVRYHVGVGYCW